MKRGLSIILFWSFVVLCSAEAIPKFIVSAQKNADSVLFSAGVKANSKPVKAIEKKDKQDYKMLLKDFNANGA